MTATPAAPSAEELREQAEQAYAAMPTDTALENALRGVARINLLQPHEVDKAPQIAAVTSAYALTAIADSLADLVVQGGGKP